MTPEPPELQGTVVVERQEVPVMYRVTDDKQEAIAPSFDALTRQADPDPARPGIEFYRRRDVIDLLLPVR